jgi:uncharacterized protein YcbX
MPAMAELDAIYCYPVKSLRGARRETTKVEMIGLEGDRRWLVVDASGRFQTITQLPKMVQVEAETKPDGIVLRHDVAGTCFVSTPRQGAAEKKVTIWEDSVRALAAGAAADKFLSLLLGAPLRLVYLANNRGRRVKTTINAGEDHVSFADVTPILLTSMTSLVDLSARRLRHRHAQVPAEPRGFGRSPFRRGHLARDQDRRRPLPRGGALREVRDHDARSRHGRADRSVRAVAHVAAFSSRA